MPGLDIATASAILKEDYGPSIIDQLNSQTVLLRKMERNKGTWSGKEVYQPVHKARNVGVGARAENATLPTAGSQQYDKALYTAKYNYCRIQLSGPVIASMAKDKTSFVRGIQSEVDGALRDSRVDINRQMWHDGSSILTQINETGSDQTIVCQSTKFIFDGMKVNILTAAGATKLTSVPTTVSASGAAGGTTFTSSSTLTGALTTTDVVIIDGARDTSNWGVHGEMWGLEALVSDSNPGNNLTDTVGGITRASNNFWKGNLLGNSGTLRQLDLDLMQQAVDQTEIVGDADPGIILTNHAIRRRYQALLQADKRYPAEANKTFDGGLMMLEFDGIPLTADKDASLTLTPQFLRRLYFITISSLSLEQLDNWDWMDKDGAILSRVSNTDAYEGSLRVYMEFTALRPNANAILADIDESP